MDQHIDVHITNAGSQMEALHFTKEGAKADQLVGDLPQLPVPVNYPVWASLVLLPLQGPDYKAEVSSQ